MADGIFHKRLQHERGDQSFDNLGSDLSFNPQPLAETSLFDMKISIQKLKFFANRHLLSIGMAERNTQEVAKGFDHFFSNVRFILDQGGDGLKCVKQEMRVELHPQSLQPSLDQTGFEF